MKHKRISFAEFMVTFVPKAFLHAALWFGVLWITQLAVTGMWYNITCASPAGCWP